MSGDCALTTTDPDAIQLPPACDFSPGDFVKYRAGRNDGAFEVNAVLSRTNKLYQVSYLLELKHAATGQILLPFVRQEQMELLNPKKAVKS